jgi:hypothetical protein
MKKIVTGMIIACGSMLLSAGAFAQDYGRSGNSYRNSLMQDRDRDRDDRDRDNGYWDRERMAREYRGAFYDRLQSDLARAESGRYLRGDDLSRFDRAHHEVAMFQSKWSRGVFDAHEMDDAIGAVQRVVDIPTLRPADHEALREDLFSMRRFRAHMEGRRY